MELIAEIVSVGTELLMGQICNTDAQYIAQRLAPLGFTVYYHTTVGDNVARLTEAVHQALSRSDIVLFTGGLGPTDDDLTKETVAAALGLSIVPFPEEVDRLTRFFTGRGRTMTPNNLKQACFPENAIILPNPKGTAPGCIMEAGGKAAVLMPGPPRELNPMFDDYVMPYLERLSGNKLVSRELRIFGMGESDVTYRLRDVIEQQTNPTIAPYVKTGEVTLRVTALAQSEAEGQALLHPMIETVRERLGDLLYSDRGEDLAELCARLLTERHETLAVAESLTGGMLTSALVDVPGSSNFLLEGAVTYSNEAKIKHLGVAPETLKRFGAVSEERAREMAEGMRAVSGADLALATTGIAGPDGGTPEKPVGTVYVALSYAGGTQVKKLALWGDRARVRSVTVLHALDILRRLLCT